MEKYIINNIPQQYLLRILLQLFVVPPYLTEDSLSKDGINFHSVMHEGLKHYGQTSDLEGFLCTCLHYAYISAGVENKKLWWWLPLKVRHESEWKIISWSKEERGDPVALHCEVFGRARDLIELELLNQGKQKETSKFLYDAGDRQVPIPSILKGTLHYLNTRPSTLPQQLTKSLVESSLKQFSKYPLVQQIHSSSSPPSKFVLIGALMVQSQNIAAAAQAEWRLYLRDFINDESGSKWRVLGYIPSYTEDWISTMQAWADIRGAAVVDKEDHKIEPSYTGQVFRPVYLFYCDQQLLGSPPQEPIKQDGIITMADYSLDYNNAGISDSEEREKDVCKVCYIPDHTDGNDIYYCDCCELCVHQLCEVPPIEDFETSIDPWYCRACLNTKGLPVPTPPPGYISRKRKYDTFV